MLDQLLMLVWIMTSVTAVLIALGWLSAKLLAVVIRIIRRRRYSVPDGTPRRYVHRNRRYIR